MTRRVLTLIAIVPPPELLSRHRFKEPALLGQARHGPALLIDCDDQIITQLLAQIHDELRQLLRVDDIAMMIPRDVVIEQDDALAADALERIDIGAGHILVKRAATQPEHERRTDELRQRHDAPPMILERCPPASRIDASACS